MTREEAIEVYNGLINEKIKEAFEFFAPELAESEDERIRKFLVDILSHGTWRKEWPFGTNEVVAYLEKQKEQKPHYSPLCNTINDKIREYIANHLIADTVVKTDMKSIVKAMEEGVRLGKEEQKPADISELMVHKEPYISPVPIPIVADEQKPAEWSEEDIDKMVNARSRKSGTTKSEMEFYRQGIKDTLKSLRPLPHWKPSEEQMEAVLTAQSVGSYGHRKALAELYNDLKKL